MTAPRWLSSLSGLPHVLTTAVIGDDGLLIEAAGGDLVGVDELAAECARLALAASSASARLNGGRLYRFSLTTERFELLLMRAGPGFTLVTAAERGADLRRVQVEMARLAVQLLDELA